MKAFKTVLKEKFNYDVSDLTAYVDEQSGEILLDIIYGSGLVDRVQVMENVKGSAKIKLLNVDFALQSADNCSMEDDGAVVFHDKTITTELVGVQFSLCNDNLNGTWAQMLNKAGANKQDRTMPLEDVITAFVIKMAKKKNQDLMFRGDTADTDPELAFYDGYLKQWNADADFGVAPRTGATITDTNAMDNAISVYDTILEEVHDNELYGEIIMSRFAARQIIKQVWNDKDYSAKIVAKNVGGELSFILPQTDMTVRSYPQLGVPAYKHDMYFVIYDYMVFGTDLENDIDGFFARYLEESEKLRFGAKWRSGVAYVNGHLFVRLAKNAS